MLTPSVTLDVRSEPKLPDGLSVEWRFHHDLACPTCQYNLRMAREPRCPECGGVFRWQALLRIACPRCGCGLEQVDGSACPRCELALDWSKLLGEADPGKLQHFEYARKPLRRVPTILLGVSRPTRFWAGIPIELTPVVGRLRRLKAALTSFALLSIFVYVLVAARSPAVVDVAVLVLAPWLTFLILPWFVPTLNRYRVRSDQMERITAYAATAMFRSAVVLLAAGGLIALSTVWWPFPVLGAPARELQPLDLITFVLFRGGGGVSEVIFNFVGAGLLVYYGFVWPTYFLAIALRRYVGIDRRNVLALLLSTQLIVFMTAVVVWCYLGSLERIAGSIFLRWFP